MTATAPILLAYSGGLDTSFLVPWLRENHGRDVVTLTVDCGGLDDDAIHALEERARALGATGHVRVDGRAALFDEVIRFLIMGNVRRGGLYPLCVGAERGLQARELAACAHRLGTDTVAHGCTAAGNDQVRFEVALRGADAGLNVLAPVRDHGWAREQQVAYLRERGLPLPPSGGTYSVNRGLWGVTIGGRETLDTRESIPESAWVLSAGALEQPRADETHSLEFEHGVPVALDGETLDPVALIEKLEAVGARFAIGRGIHLGETLLGTRGRVAFEAPAAEVLLTAHRELEKLVLSGQQLRLKEPLAAAYGELIHAGQHGEPACRDIEAFLISTQERVTGRVTVQLAPRSVFVSGVESPHSLFHATRGKYGEAAGEWTAEEATGFARIVSLPSLLHARAGTKRE